MRTRSRAFPIGIAALLPALLLSTFVLDVGVGRAGALGEPERGAWHAHARIQVLLQAKQCAAASPDAMAAARQIMLRRATAFGATAPRVSLVGRCRMEIDASGVTSQAAFLQVLTRVGRLVLYGMGSLPHFDAGARFPYSTHTFCSVPHAPTPCVVLTGADLNLSSIAASVDQYGSAQVNFAAKGAGARRLRDYTGSHVGQSMALVLDGVVFTDPTIQSELPGAGVINAIGSLDEAKAIVVQLKYGALPIAFAVVRSTAA